MRHVIELTAHEVRLAVEAHVKAKHPGLFVADAKCDQVVCIVNLAADGATATLSNERRSIDARD